jgi:hypothetical protein
VHPPAAAAGGRASGPIRNGDVRGVLQTAWEGKLI